jgi:hypothetical protein
VDEEHLVRTGVTLAQAQAAPARAEQFQVHPERDAPQVADAKPLEFGGRPPCGAHHLGEVARGAGIEAIGEDPGDVMDQPFRRPGRNTLEDARRPTRISMASSPVTLSCEIITVGTL